MWVIWFLVEKLWGKLDSQWHVNKGRLSSEIHVDFLKNFSDLLFFTFYFEKFQIYRQTEKMVQETHT